MAKINPMKRKSNPTIVLVSRKAPKSLRYIIPTNIMHTIKRIIKIIKIYRYVSIFLYLRLALMSLFVFEALFI